MSSMFHRCQFCGGTFIYRKGQRFCSEFCQTSFDKFQQFRTERRYAEEAAAFEVEQRRTSGQTMHICSGCCAVFYAVGEREFCSAACQQIYGAETSCNGQKSAREAPSLHVLMRNEEQKTAAQNPVKKLNKRRVKAILKADEIGQSWLEPPPKKAYDDMILYYY